MKTSLLVVIIITLFTTPSFAQIILKVEVTASTSTTADIRFSVSSPNNTFSASSDPNFLPEFIFIDYTGNTNLTAAFSSSQNFQTITSFASNTLAGNGAQTVSSTEIRGNDAGFDRIGFHFNSNLSQSSSLVDGTEVSYTVGTNGTTLTTTDFSGLNVYWGSSSDTGSFTGGVLIGTTSAVPEPSTYAAIFGAIALLGTIAVRKRAKWA